MDPEHSSGKFVDYCCLIGIEEPYNSREKALCELAERRSLPPHPFLSGDLCTSNEIFNIAVCI